VEQLPLKFAFDTAESIPDEALSVEQYKDGMRRLAQPAINAMRLLLENPNTPPHVLANVAQTVIHAAFGKPKQAIDVEHSGNLSTTVLTPERFEQICRELADDV
jgi:hypothetical protein